MNLSFSLFMMRLAAATCLATVSLTSLAQHQTKFSLPATKASYAINGQIDWAGDRLAGWSGPVVVLMNPGEPINRDGWQLADVNSDDNARLPIKDFAEVLVQEGMAVVRFDNPGVAPPEKNCRGVVSQKRFDDEVLRLHCLDLEIYGKYSEEMFTSSIEKMLTHVQSLALNSRKLVLVGFADGMVHATSIADRRKIKISALVSVGSPAESPAVVARWRELDRAFSTLPKFDANRDGVVTDKEISKGYREGIGNFMPIEEWFGKDGRQPASPNGSFRKNRKEAYELALEMYENDDVQEGIVAKWHLNGVPVPLLNTAMHKIYFGHRIAPIAVMDKLNIPGLFLWGENDEEMDLQQQVKLIASKTSSGKFIWYEIYDDRFGRLSRRADDKWPERAFMRQLAHKIRDFLFQSGGREPLDASR